MHVHRQPIVTAGLAIILTAAQAPATRIAPDEFIALHGRGQALVVDVRTASSFKEGHIAGAVNVPLDRLEARVRELREKAAGRTVVTYCACPDEHASLAAVRVLSEHGLTNVVALTGGLKAWVEKGGRVEKEMPGV